MTESNHEPPSVVGDYATLGATCGVLAAIFSVAIAYGYSGSLTDEKSGLFLPILYIVSLSIVLGLLGRLAGSLVNRTRQNR
jgi:hypothetical protein